MTPNCARYDRGEVRGDAKITDEGYIRANAVVTRTGIFLYKNPDGSIRRELRHPDDVWHADSIETMEMIPITNNHPEERLVTAKNSKRLAIGYTGQKIKRDGEYVIANLVITDNDGVDEVRLNGKKELSLGYTVDLEDEQGVYNGEPYDARQRNIRYNHLAIVDRARAGNEARIALDSQDAVEITMEINMSKRKIKIDAEELIVEPATADYVDRLHEDLRNLEDERKRVEDEIKMIRDRLEKAEAERDAMRDKMSEMQKETMMNHDSAEFKKAVSERVKLYETAKEYLGSDTKLDSMSDLQIKRAVIAKCRKSINLDGKSEVYVDAMFDTIVDENVLKQVKVDSIKYSENNDSDDSAASARKKMMEKQRKASQGGK